MIPVRKNPHSNSKLNARRHRLLKHTGECKRSPSVLVNPELRKRRSDRDPSKLVTVVPSGREGHYRG